MDAYPDPGIQHLGDPTRRRIFELLARQASTVGELARQLPVSRPAVSQHLRVLRDAGLVSTRADGTRLVYQVDPEGIAAMRAYLDLVWQDALRSLQKAAAAADPDKEHE